jgi:hypothetical protein
LAFGRRVDSLGDPLVNAVTERNRFMASINVYVPHPAPSVYLALRIHRW